MVSIRIGGHFTRLTGCLADANNNYLSDESTHGPEDESPSLRDVGIQCNLKKYQTPLKESAADYSLGQPLSQKPPIKVIKSSTNGFVSAYSDVPRLTSQPTKATLESPYCALDFDRGTATPEPGDAIYSQVDKSGKHRPPSSQNLSIVYKQPLNESLTSYRSVNDGKLYDVKTKEFGFNVNNANAPRINLPTPTAQLLDQSRLVRSYNGSYRDLHEPVENEVLEETISISNASTDDDAYRPMDRLTVERNRYPDNLSFTGHSITSKASSNYRRESPVRHAYDRTSLSKQSPYGTMEKSREEKGKLKKKKNAPNKNDENVLLANNSLRLKSSRNPTSERLYKSNADLRDQFRPDETRGGLAAAYKNRQNQNQNRHRALSLSRMNAPGPDDEPHRGSPSFGGPVPARHLSQTHLNGGGGTSSRLSDSGSSYHRAGRHAQHERDPIVMYIPTATNQRSTGESPKLTSILRNNSTKSTATLPSKAKKAKEAKSQSKVNLKEAAAKEKEKIAAAERKKKADLNRRHSMPKDTKPNGWLSKFKLKSK